MEFVIVTGVSGAGKSGAAHALEDLGFFCMDNMPPKLLSKFIELGLQLGGKVNRVAIVVDVRVGEMFAGLLDSLDEMEAQGINHRLLFLDASDEVILRRFKETRRRHPLMDTAGIDSVEDALAIERALLMPARERSDYVIDTSMLNPSNLKEKIGQMFLEPAQKGMYIHCVSFGYKYGAPREADLMFDVRCLPNPFYQPELRPLTGLDKQVADYVLEAEDTKGFVRRLDDMIDYMLPLYTNEGKSRLVIAIGCTGGKHRSVALVEQLGVWLKNKGYTVTVEHRDFKK